MPSILSDKLSSVRARFDLINCRQLGSFLDDVIEAHLDRLSDAPLFVQICYALNILGFIGWYSNPRFMQKHFRNSFANLKAGRYYTLFSSTFLHSSLSTLLPNLDGLLRLSPSVLYGSGLVGFFVTFISSTICSSVTSLAANQVILKFFPNNKSALLERQNGTSGLSGTLSGFTIPHLWRLNNEFPNQKVMNSPFLSLLKLLQFQQQNTPITAIEDVQVNLTCLDYLGLSVASDLVQATGVIRTSRDSWGSLGGYVGGAVGLALTLVMELVVTGNISSTSIKYAIIDDE
jgi:hypothetical protein